jgi:hypothetical protein
MVNLHAIPNVLTITGTDRSGGGGNPDAARLWPFGNPYLNAKVALVEE